MRPNAIASQLGNEDIANVAAFFAAQQDATAAAKLDADKKPTVGADGFYAADQHLFCTAMARDAGWGKDIPDMLRNADWNYAVFTTSKQLRPGVIQAKRLACHKPLDKASCTFTIDQIAAAAKAR